MVFIMNREGTIVETVTSPVHQGSNANEILLLAPFAPTNTVTVGFKLPNGILIQPRLSESGTGETMKSLEVNDLFLKIGADEESMSAWYIKINRDLTRYSGELGIQFFIYDGAGDILASSYATVTVQKGVAILDGTTFDTSTATQLQAELNKVYAALTAVQSNKVDKINTPHALYATDENGEDTFIGFSYDGKPSAGEIPMYMRNGTLPVGTPEADGDATTKSYVDDAKGEAFSFAFETATQIDLSYDEEKEELTLNRPVGPRVVPLTGVTALKDRVDFITTLLFNTIITMTEVEDNYATRVTAGGLPVVSNTPTTVHKIAGDTKASENLFPLTPRAAFTSSITANDNTWTFNGLTPSNTYTNFIDEIDITNFFDDGEKFTISQSVYYSSHTVAGAVYLNVQVRSGDTIVQQYQCISSATTVTMDKSLGSYYLRVICGNNLSEMTQTISFMVNRGDAALPYEDFAGLKNASFKGVASTGRNLIEFEAIYDYADKRVASLGVPLTYGGVTYTLYKDHLVLKGTNTTEGYVGFNLRFTHTIAKGTIITVQRFNHGEKEETFSVPINGSGKNAQEFTQNSGAKAVIADMNNIWAYVKAGETVDADFQYMVVLGSETLTVFEEPVSDTSFQLSTARPLRKWDYIDIDNQRLVTGTAEVTQGTEFTDEELATYPAGYILSADRKTIAYPLATPTTTPLTVPQTYTVWRNGSETVDTGDADALPPTITQTYYEEVTSA